MSRQGAAFQSSNTHMNKKSGNCIQVEVFGQSYLNFWSWFSSHVCTCFAPGFWPPTSPRCGSLQTNELNHHASLLTMSVAACRCSFVLLLLNCRAIYSSIDRSSMISEKGSLCTECNLEFPKILTDTSARCSRYDD